MRDRYIIVDKLGFGGYSTVWLARDKLKQRYVALKINIANFQSREAKILKTLSVPVSPNPILRDGSVFLPKVLDEFRIDSPNGRHSCYAMEVAGSDLREISFSRLFSLEVSHALAYSLVLAVAYSHSLGIARGDLHLRNMILKLPSSLDSLSIDQFYAKYGKPELVEAIRCDGQPLPPGCPAKAVIPLSLSGPAESCTLNEAKLTLRDFGSAFSPAEQEHLGKDCHTPPPYRAPKATFEPDKPLYFASDIWSLATALWEIIGMKAVFSTDYVSADEIIAQHV
ncbi:hypothetical protein NLG97_g8190 [Lecanicillium saksenae]|uniref:Uncharacterized protein n=1 Tax=Lecanicillium saksenae TaxID=468837 RepID=A0ACC1QJN9_9HYPO|nr:hypothetical protein NLG97_g8190 [Lecanicillium saksenae]